MKLQERCVWKQLTHIQILVLTINLEVEKLICLNDISYYTKRKNKLLLMLMLHQNKNTRQEKVKSIRLKTKT